MRRWKRAATSESWCSTSRSGLTRLAAAAAAAIAIAALVHTLLGSSSDPAAGRESSPERLRGPDVPAPGALEGALVVAAGSGCRPLRLDLATLELAPLDDRTICDGTPEGGETGVLVSDRPGERGVFGDGGVVLGEAELRSGFRRAPSGHVHPVGADRREDGLLAVVVSAAPRDIRDVLEDAGFDVRDDDDLAAARRELGLTGPFGAMALSGGGSVPQTTLQLWRDGRLEVAYPLRAAAYPFANRRFGELVRFSPDGSELLLGFESPGSPVLLLDVATLRTALRPTLQHGVAWSPDGAYFALSTGSEIRIAGALRSQAAYVLPVAASALSWLPE